MQTIPDRREPAVTNLVVCAPIGGDMPITRIDFDPSTFDDVLFHQAGLSLPEHIQRSVTRRRAEYFFGRLAAKLSLDAMGVTDTHVATGPSRQPLWPTGTTGSITHTHDVAMACVVPTHAARGIGIDVEHVVDGRLANAMRGMVLDDEELAQLLTAMDDVARASTLAFSAKESFYKGVFCDVGRLFEFDALSIVGVDAGRNTLHMRVDESLSPRFVRGTLVEVGFDWLAPHEVLTWYRW